MLSASYYLHLSSHSDVIEALNHDLDAQWWEFGTHLHIEPAFMDSIGTDYSTVRERMLQRWLQNGWFMRMELVTSLAPGRQ